MTTATQVNVQNIPDIAIDTPIPLLFRRKVVGTHMLWAYIDLKKGCHVDVHTHESEQMSYVISGKVRWLLGQPGTPEYREVEAGGQTMIDLPPNFPHGIDILEDCMILDVLSPAGNMGVDRQGKG